MLFVHSLAGGGTERTAATLANYWARTGWGVTVVTLAAVADDFYVLDTAVDRVALHLSGDSRGLVHAALQNGQRVAALRKAIRRHRPDIVLSMMSTPNVLLACASRTLPNLRTIGSEHCYPPHAPLGPIWSALRRRAYGRLSAVVALTRECADWIGAHTTATRVPVIPNPVLCPLPDDAPRVDPHRLCAPERKVLLAVGRLASVKNYEMLLRAFARLAGRYPDWDLVMLGEGPQRLLLESRIRDADLSTRVFLPGIAGNVGSWYARADLYVMTSHSEGFPNALAEALAHGVPAVSVDCDTGPRDIIRHGVDGLLVRPDDPTALAAALDRVMGDPALRRGFAARAGEARERFSIEKIAGMWTQLFMELAGARAPASTSTSTSTTGAGPTTRRAGP